MSNQTRTFTKSDLEFFLGWAVTRAFAALCDNNVECWNNKLEADIKHKIMSLMEKAI